MYAINQRFRQLEEQVEIACNVKDPEVAASLRKYCAVLVCGFVERSVEVIVLERLRGLAHPKVRNFIKSYFNRGRNFNCNSICNLLERFDSGWGSNFRKFIENSDKEVMALNSIYSVRNSVAHGVNVGISAVDLRERLDSVKVIVDALILATDKQ